MQHKDEMNENDDAANKPSNEPSDFMLKRIQQEIQNRQDYSIDKLVEAQQDARLVTALSEYDVMELERITADPHARDNSDLERLKTVRDKLALTQTEMMHLAAMDDSGIPKAYEKARRFVLGKLLRKKTYTADDLFELQAENTNELNDLLKRLIKYSRALEDELGSCFKGRIVERRLAHINSGMALSDMKRKLTRYNEALGYASGLTWDSGLDWAIIDAFDLKCQTMASGYRAELHKAVGKYLENEASFIEALHTSLVNSTNSCENLHTGTMLVMRTLKTARKVYVAQLEQAEVTQSLYTQLNGLSQNVSNVCGRLTPALHQLMTLGQEPIESLSSNGEALKKALGNHNGKPIGALDVSSTMRAMSSPVYLPDPREVIRYGRAMEAERI